MRSLFIFIFISFFILVSISLTEIYLRYLGLGDPVRYDSNYIYGYAPKENQKKERLRGSIVTINELGLRTPFSWNNLEKKKIIFMGDSITYGGSYIDDKDIFSNLVCEEIKKYICGNAGVNAYSVQNMVLRSKYDKRIHNGQIYIFLFAPGDFYREYADSNTAHFYLNRKEFFLPAITEALSFIATKYDLNNFISKKDDTKINRNQRDLIDFSILMLVEEISRLEKNGKQVINFYTIERDDKNSKKELNSYILSKLKEINIKNFFTLENVLIDDELFYDGVHYSQSGHKKVSKEISSKIKFLGLN